MHTSALKLGVFSLTDMSSGAEATDRVRDIVEYGARADALGLDVFGVGEHHTARFAVSSPAVVLGGVAARTSSITLTSAVSVLSVLDPVRLYQDFAQLDLLSAGRAEITAGRSAYTEPFGLFGVPVEDYDQVFEEKLDLLLRLRTPGTVTWRGRYRPALRDALVTPWPGRPLPIRVAVGGTPQSAARAARLGLPMTLATLLGDLSQARPLTELYRQTAEESGHPNEQLGVGVVTHMYVGPTSQAARDTFYPHYRSYFADGRGVHLSRAHFDALAEPDSALMVGSPQEIVDKIMRQRAVLGGLDRFMGQIDLGGLSRHDVLASLERFATEVAPVLRRETTQDKHRIKELL
jgi:alkanesulfonate monooxygenase SsuD/methylene tetrahydromethanopterin reductase-like flavin-dependent oxidoreductase (luciferase family)